MKGRVILREGARTADRPEAHMPCFPVRLAVVSPSPVGPLPSGHCAYYPDVALTKLASAEFAAAWKAGKPEARLLSVSGRGSKGGNVVGVDPGGMALVVDQMTYQQLGLETHHPSAKPLAAATGRHYLSVDICGEHLRGSALPTTRQHKSKRAGAVPAEPATKAKLAEAKWRQRLRKCFARAGSVSLLGAQVPSEALPGVKRVERPVVTKSQTVGSSLLPEDLELIAEKDTALNDFLDALGRAHLGIQTEADTERTLHIEETGTTGLLPHLATDWLKTCMDAVASSKIEWCVLTAWGAEHAPSSFDKMPHGVDRSGGHLVHVVFRRCREGKDQGSVETKVIQCVNAEDLTGPGATLKRRA